ncbi:MAG: imidazoleglycerol-phosphate dehydratase [Thermodesulfobacteriota bacterium]|nr:imidazoleglycerol-phosphate dehydratase [Thermodesulfobacteriota bacterium]
MRKAHVKRKTSETEVEVKLVLEGTGTAEVSTGIGFLDHMLHHVAKHGLFDLDVKATGDLEVDNHHTIEDVARSIGEAFREALGNKQGIRRYGNVTLPMDEALAGVFLDFSGRPLLVYHNPLGERRSGESPLDLVSIFLQGFSDRAGITLHVRVENAQDPHHAAEAVFKALGRALRQATEIDPRVEDIPSTKGILE